MENDIVNILNIVFTVISGVCTFFSVKSSIKSKEYYKKSHYLAEYADTNRAFCECKKIISSLTQLLKALSSRGTNVTKKVNEVGESIRNSINQIKEVMPPQNVAEIKNILNSNDISVDSYVNSLIYADLKTIEKLNISDKIEKLQEIFNELLQYIKTHLDETSGKLK